MTDLPDGGPVDSTWPRSDYLADKWDRQITPFKKTFRGRVDVSTWEFDCHIGKRKRKAISETIEAVIKNEGVYWTLKRTPRKILVQAHMPLGKSEDYSVISEFDLRDLIRAEVAWSCLGDEGSSYDDLIKLLQSYIRDVERARRDEEKLDKERGYR